MIVDPIAKVIVDANEAKLLMDSVISGLVEVRDSLEKGEPVEDQLLEAVAECEASIEYTETVKRQIKKIISETVPPRFKASYKSAKRFR
ncbi:MAG: hypothetical protein ACOYB8_04765 [Eubacteriaceae bacterium]|jgi:hypothetical protein